MPRLRHLHIGGGDCGNDARHCLILHLEATLAEVAATSREFVDNDKDSQLLAVLEGVTGLVFVGIDILEAMMKYMDKHKALDQTGKDKINDAIRRAKDRLH